MTTLEATTRPSWKDGFDAEPASCPLVSTCPVKLTLTTSELGSAANTHTAVDTLLSRIYDLQGPIEATLAATGYPLPPLRYVRVNSVDTAPNWRLDVGTLNPS